MGGFCHRGVEQMSVFLATIFSGYPFRPGHRCLSSRYCSYWSCGLFLVVSTKFVYVVYHRYNIVSWGQGPGKWLFSISMCRTGLSSLLYFRIVLTTISLWILTVIKEGMNEWDVLPLMVVIRAFPLLFHSLIDWFFNLVEVEKWLIHRLRGQRLSTCWM